MPKVPQINLPKPPTPEVKTTHGCYGIDAYAIKKVIAANAARRGIKRK